MIRSRLSLAQRRVVLAVVALGLFMLADTLYLLTNRLAAALGWRYFAVTDVSLPPIHQVLVLSHTGVGLLLVAVALFFVVWHLAPVWRRTRRRAIATGIITVVLGLILAITGLFIVSAASNRDSPLAYWSHVVAAAAIPWAYLAHRRVTLWRPSARSYRVAPAVVLGLLLLSVVLHGLTYNREAYTAAATQAFAAGKEKGPGGAGRRVADYAPPGYVPANYVPVTSPFFPAPTTTTTGDYLPTRVLTREDQADPGPLARDLDRYGFAVDTRIGAASCGRCHAGIVEQWAASAHRYASFNNPFYEATIVNMRAYSANSNPEIDAHVKAFPDLAGREAKVKSKWCSGCHDPALMLAGQMTGEVDRRQPSAQAGLTCLACHAIDQTHGRTGNGNYNVADAQEDPYLFADAADGMGRFLHDTVLQARPEVHKQQMLKPYFRTSDYCGTCHKVSLDTRLNGYRWVRGQNEFDNWHDSGVARNASRTFYLPANRRACQDCHMPYEPVTAPDVSARDGRVRSHRFLAANTALPYVRGDQQTLARTEAYLRADKLRVDLVALRRPDGRVESLLDPATPRLHPGETVGFEVVVRNSGVGHTFPGGTNDSNEAWLELTLLDDAGHLLASSGRLMPDGYVDPDAHFYHSLMVDRTGQPIHRRNAQDIVTPVYTRVIGPGTADVAHYQWQVPAQAGGGGVQLRARLLWRKFDRAYTEFAYRNNPQGFRAFAAVPDLPVTEIASVTRSLTVDRVAAVPTAGALLGAPAAVSGDRRTGTVALSAADGSSIDDPTLVAGGGPGAPAPAGQSAATVPPSGGRPSSAATGPSAAGPASGGAAVAGSAPTRVDDWMRLNDWGIGLLLQDDTRGAAAAFGQLAQVAPQRLDGPRNLARVAVADGDLKAAYTHLQQAEALAPGDPQTAWVWGTVLQRDGRYTEAALAYRRVLEVFPEDRATWRNLGRVLYLDGKMEEALGAFDRVLAIDPEDRVAHYHRMLVLRALGRDDEAQLAAAAYKYYQIDESAAEVTRQYRLSHPADNHEALAVHVHELVPPGGGER